MSLARRHIVAVAISDQLGAALAAESEDTREINRR
jgi:hypothetical protein